MFKKLKEINKKSNTEKISRVFIIVTILHLLNVFVVYFSTSLNLSNPLIPKYLAFETFNPYAEKGIILTFGLLIATILKFLKQHLIAILVCMIILTLYYLTSFEPNFSEYPN